jgi:hypothetical protein
MAPKISIPPQDPTVNGHPDGAEAPKPTGPDPFDLEALRLDGSFAAARQVKKLLTSVPIRKPDKSWFVRTHPHESYRILTGAIELKDDRELYVVAKKLWPELVGEPTFRWKMLVTAVNRQGDLFLWELNLPREDGKVDKWAQSAMDAATWAQDNWARVTANMSLGAYDVSLATGRLPDPEWPEMSFNEIMRIALRDRYITDANHDVLRRLRGEV